jgi:hypothetical protein
MKRVSYRDSIDQVEICEVEEMYSARFKKEERQWQGLTNAILVEGL